MSAVWMRVRAELRSRRRSTIALGIVIGLLTGPAIAAAAGARRTESAYPRFVREYRGADMMLPGIEFAVVSPDQLAGIPQVAEVEPFHWAVMLVRERFVIAHAVSRDRLGVAIDRFQIVEGRAPDPARPEEVLLSIHGRDSGFRVGEEFPFEPVEEPGPEFEQYNAAAARHVMKMRIVGVAAAPGGFPPQVSEISPMMYLTPAFYRLLPNAFGSDSTPSVIRLKNPSEFPQFAVHLARLSGVDQPALFNFFSRSRHDANVQRSFHLQAQALWLLAILAAAAFILIFSQLLARQAFLDSAEHGALAALGMTNRQRWAASMARATITALLSAAVAIPVALLLSPIMPTGLARLAEPHPGFDADWTALGAGTVIVAFLVLGLTALPAWRASRVRARVEVSAATDAPSRSAELLAKAGAGPATVAGVRLALERGRGATAVPVRTTIAGVTIGLAAVVAALTFGASLRNLGDTPRLYGISWDLVVAHDESDFTKIGDRFLEVPEVRGVASGSLGLALEVNGVGLADVMAIDSVSGAGPLPPLLQGRAPTRSSDPPEIALGARTMRQLGVKIGDTVAARSPDFDRPVRFLVVGRAVLPSGNETSRTGEGAWISRLGLLSTGAVSPEAEPRRSNYAFIELAPGASPDSVFPKIAERLGLTPEEQIYRPPFYKPTDVVSFGRVQRLPEILGGLLALTSAAALTHSLITAVRRRRRDLAVLKSMGFTRRQVRVAIAVQATTLALVALAVGVPLGVVAGRTAWRAFATDLGVIPSVVVPIGSLMVALAGALLIANIVAALPARAAARMRPALVLRTE